MSLSWAEWPSSADEIRKKPMCIYFTERWTVFMLLGLVANETFAFHLMRCNGGLLPVLFLLLHLFLTILCRVWYADTCQKLHNGVFRKWQKSESNWLVFTLLTLAVDYCNGKNNNAQVVTSFGSRPQSEEIKCSVKLHL